MRCINFENATIWRQYQWAGKPYNSKRVTLRGDLIFPSTRTRPPFWKYNCFTKELIMSSYHLSDENMKLYVEEIKKYNPYDLYAYPSSAYLLANFCKRYGIDLKFSCVFTSSEMLLEYQKNEIESAFHCKVYDWYGSAERVAAIGHCEHGNYHEMSDYSIIEYIPRDNGTYEIVGTSLNNYVMPLIRYRLGDIIELEDGTDICSCKRHFKRIKRMHGREASFIITPEQRKVSILNHIPWGIDNLIEIQYIQKKIDEIEVRIVTQASFNKNDLAVLQERLKTHISPNIRYIMKKVPYIERSSLGKFQAVIQEIN